MVIHLDKYVYNGSHKKIRGDVSYAPVDIQVAQKRKQDGELAFPFFRGFHSCLLHIELHNVKMCLLISEAGADPYPPGPGHVPHQDDWLNPDTSKLPPVPTVPNVNHVITKEEARNYPVVAGAGIAAAATLPTLAAAATGGAAGFGATLLGTGGSLAGTLVGGLDSIKDWSEGKFSGKIVQYPDQDSSHLVNQRKGYTD